MLKYILVFCLLFTGCGVIRGVKYRISDKGITEVVVVDKNEKPNKKRYHWLQLEDCGKVYVKKEVYDNVMVGEDILFEGKE